jgi:TRAP-type C4-dicarboxylate transport system permease small subunit
LLPLARALAAANRVMVGFGMLALLAASLVLTSSVVTRYLFKSSTDWQDETAVFLLVGATFLCGAFVQSIRGHVGIEAVSTLLSRAPTRSAASASTCSASPSAACSRGSRGRSCTRPGSTSRRRRRRGRRRSGSRTC